MMYQPGPHGQEDDEFEQPGAFWRALGLPQPVYLDESLAPPVDHDVLLRLARRELSENAVDGALRLVSSFKSWYTAFTDALVAEYHRTNGYGTIRVDKEGSD